MALIPNLRGIVVEILTLTDRVYKSALVLERSSQNYPDRDLPNKQIAKSKWAMEEFNVKVGDVVSLYAFPLGEENTWEMEGRPFVLKEI